MNAKEARKLSDFANGTERCKQVHAAIDITLAHIKWEAQQGYTKFRLNLDDDIAEEVSTKLQSEYGYSVSYNGTNYTVSW